MASYTNFPQLRLEIDFTVGVTEDLVRVRKLLLDMLRGDERFEMTPTPSVVVTELNDYNVAMQLTVWLHDERQHLVERCALRERVFETLRAAEVDMPFETLQVSASQGDDCCLALRGGPHGETDSRRASWRFWVFGEALVQVLDPLGWTNTLVCRSSTCWKLSRHTLLAGNEVYRTMKA